MLTYENNKLHSLPIEWWLAYYLLAYHVLSFCLDFVWISLIRVDSSHPLTWGLQWSVVMLVISSFENHVSNNKKGLAAIIYSVPNRE